VADSILNLEPQDSMLPARRLLVRLEGARVSGPVLAAGLVARVRPLAAVPALVPHETARLAGPVLAPGLVARVRPLAAMRALVRAP
jgi:hypothetical protein